MTNVSMNHVLLILLAVFVIGGLIVWRFKQSATPKLPKPTIHDVDTQEDLQNKKEVVHKDEPLVEVKPFVLSDEKRALLSQEDTPSLLHQEKTQIQEQDQPTQPPVEEDIDLTQGLIKTKEGLLSRLSSLFNHKEIPIDLLAKIEDILLTSDVGIKTTQKIIEETKSLLNQWQLNDSQTLNKTLASVIQNTLNEVQTPWLLSTQKPHVILMVGVNGVGKTTSIGKLAAYFKSQNKRVLVAAGDTFRAAAAPQLKIWAERTDALYFSGQKEQDPASVLYGACEYGVQQQVDIILADTAGRLHTKSNLMDELKKIKKVVGKVIPGAPHDVFLVVDSTTGQNAVLQAREFNDSVGLSGLVLTKLDGTARGGVVVGISAEVKVPIRFIGIGEKATDLKPFHPEQFVKALLS